MEQAVKQETVLFGLCTVDRAFSDRLERALRVWSETVCADVRLYVRPDWASFFADGRASDCSVLFLDADGEELPPPDALKAAMWHGALLFCSSSPHAAIDSYAFHPAGFLSKPVSAADLERPLARCFPHWQRALRRMEVFSDRSRLHIPMSNLIWAEASGRSCILHVPQGTLPAGISLMGLTWLLPEESFLRCQKSFLVNLHRIQSTDGKFFQMSEGSPVPIGRDCRGAALSTYASFLKRWAWKDL